MSFRTALCLMWAASRLSSSPEQIKPGVILLAADRSSTLSSGQSSGLQPSYRPEASLLSTFLLDKETGSWPEDGPFVAVMALLLTRFSRPQSRYRAFCILSGYRILGCAAISSRRPIFGHLRPQYFPQHYQSGEEGPSLFSVFSAQAELRRSLRARKLLCTRSHPISYDLPQWRTKIALRDVDSLSEARSSSTTYV